MPKTDHQKNVREIQAAVGPEVWPKVDEAFNEIRRQCAAELQEQGEAHREETAKLTDAIAILQPKADRLDEIEKPDVERRKEALAAEIAAKQQELESIR